MRALIVFAVLLICNPTFAAEWGRYDNARFGYGIDIPPGFVGAGESDNGDGQVFEPANGAETLRVWGGFALDGFEREVASRMQAAQDDGWNLTYQATTPHWASFSGKVGKMILYQRMTEICDGSGYATFQLTYSAKNLSAMDPVVERLVRSLRDDGGAC